MFNDWVQLLTSDDVKPDSPLLSDKIKWLLKERNSKNRDEGSLQSWLTDLLLRAFMVDFPPRAPEFSAANACFEDIMFSNAALGKQKEVFKRRFKDLPETK